MPMSISVEVFLYPVILGICIDKVRRRIYTSFEHLVTRRRVCVHVLPPRSNRSLQREIGTSDPLLVVLSLVR